MVDSAARQARMAVRLYTDHYLVRGSVSTTRERLVDVLNGTSDYVVLENAFFDEFGSREIVGQAPFVRVNLAMIILAAPEDAVEPAADAIEPAAEAPGTATRDQVLLAVPPYRITGRLELRNDQDLRDGIEGLSSRFVEVTEATFWSESLNEPRTRAPLVAVNHRRSHVVAPFEERDVWAGVDDGSIRRGEGEAVRLAESADSGVWVMDSNVGSLAPRET